MRPGCGCGARPGRADASILCAKGAKRTMMDGESQVMTPRARPDAAAAPDCAAGRSRAAGPQARRGEMTKRTHLVPPPARRLFSVARRCSYAAALVHAWGVTRRPGKAAALMVWKAAGHSRAAGRGARRREMTKRTHLIAGRTCFCKQKHGTQLIRRLLQAGHRSIQVIGVTCLAGRRVRGLLRGFATITRLCEIGRGGPRGRAIAFDRGARPR